MIAVARVAGSPEYRDSAVLILSNILYVVYAYGQNCGGSPADSRGVQELRSDGVTRQIGPSRSAVNYLCHGCR